MRNQTKTKIPGTPKIQANKYFMTPVLPRINGKQFCFQSLRGGVALWPEQFRCYGLQHEDLFALRLGENKEETSSFKAGYGFATLISCLPALAI